MNTQLARLLTGFYPKDWRERYREEFECFLGSHRTDMRTIVNVIGWAMLERILCGRRLKMSGRENSVTLMLFAILAAGAAGINLYWTVDDTPLAAAMKSHWALSASWNLVAAGSLLAFAVCAVAGIPAFVSMVTKAFAGGRWGVLWRLAVPALAGLVMVLWLIAGMIIAGGHWVPTPWDVTGRLVGPGNWPPLGTRWTLSVVSLVLMVASLISSGLSLRQAVIGSDWTRFRRGWFTVSSVVVAASMGLMAAGVLMLGWFAQQIASSDFHAQSGGFFGSTIFASWVASFVVFLLAAAMAAFGVRSAMVSTAE